MLSAPVIFNRIARLEMDMHLSSPELTKTLAPPLTALVIDKAHLVQRRIDEGDPATPIVTTGEIETIIENAAATPQVAAATAPKKWTRSRGVLAGLAIAIMSGGGVFWETLAAQDMAEIINHLDAVLVGVLGLVAAYGRIKARRAIG